MRKVSIPKDLLQNLYLIQKLSTRKIAQKYACAKSTIDRKLKAYDIAIRNKSEALKLILRTEKYRISKEKLEELYEVKKLSAYKIAELYNCSPSAIAHKLRRFNIPRRTDVEGIILTNNERCRKIAKAVTRYPKKDFDGSGAEKAYLIGFRLGDMSVAKKRYGDTVYAASSTSKKEQVVLMCDLFKEFGHIHVNKSLRNTKNGEKDHFQFIAHLNSSFDFLLDKKDEIEAWILDNDNCFLSFLAGYIDAEGSFGVYSGFGSFALGSYDKNIISKVHTKLKLFGIESENPRIIVRGGYVDKRGVKTHKDVWSLRIRRKKELDKFINLIEPHVRHLKRKNDLLRVKNNIDIRNYL